MVNISGFLGHMVSNTTIQSCHCGMKAATDNMQKDGSNRVPQKLVTKTGGSLDWLAGYHLPTSALEPCFSKCVVPRASHTSKELVRNAGSGTSLMAQWLRLRTPNAGGPGSIPGQGTRSHMPQLRVRMLQLKIPRAATKTQHSQINIF